MMMMTMMTRNYYVSRACLILLAVWRCSSFTIQTRPLFPARPTSHSATALHGVAELSTVESFFISQPYIAAFLTCSVKASAADWIAQTQQQQRQESLDVARNAGFILYGGLYQGCAQQFMYSRIFPDIFGHDLDLLGLASQVFFDMMFVGPLLCLPMAYAAKTLCTSCGESKLQALQEGLKKYGHDVTTQGLLFKYWALWTPVNFITFGVIPLHFRVAFVACISFFWIFILSSVAGAEPEATRIQEKTA